MIATLALIAGLVTGYAVGWTLGFRAAWDGKSRRAASGKVASHE